MGNRRESGLLEGRRKGTRGERQVAYVMERGDNNCGGDGSQESVGTRIEGANRQIRRGSRQANFSEQNREGGSKEGGSGRCQH